MVAKKSSPYRTINSRVSFNPLVFREKLLGALNGVDLEIGNQFRKGHPFENWVAPSGCDNSGYFGVNYLLGQILSKFDDGKPSQAKTDKTMERFYEAEERCFVTNESLRKRQGKWYSGSTGITLGSVLHTAKQKISSLLGDFSWDEASDGFAWGPGSTTRLPRRKADAVYKYMGNPHTTADNLELATAAIASVPLWTEEMLSEGQCLEVIRGNKIITVPKNYKTDRTIAVEPCMNMFIQKGIGSMIRRRLKRVGVDLDDQTKNQDAAKLASKFENLATLDLSMASDTVSTEIVRELLPPNWLDALEQCRSPEGVLPSGSIVTYQKFSSMGNGYTFELESLIFWAICSSVLDLFHIDDKRLCVYGDDLIVSVRAVEHVAWALDGFGFVLNADKSHSDGPFRESCGKHFFGAHDVTPIYHRSPIKTNLDLFLLHNNLWRWRERQHDTHKPYIDEERFSSLLRWLRACASYGWRKPRIPDGVGDGAFIGTFAECRPKPVRSSLKLGHGHEGFEVPTMQEVTVSRVSQLSGQLMRSLAYLNHRLFDHLDHLDPRIGISGVPIGTRVRVVYIRIVQWSPESVSSRSTSSLTS